MWSRVSTFNFSWKTQLNMHQRREGKIYYRVRLIEHLVMQKLILTDFPPQISKFCIMLASHLFVYFFTPYYLFSLFWFPAYFFSSLIHLYFPVVSEYVMKPYQNRNSSWKHRISTFIISKELAHIWIYHMSRMDTEWDFCTDFYSFCK